MKIANSKILTLFAGAIGLVLMLGGTQAKAGAIDEIVDNVVVSVVESLTKDLRDDTRGGKEQQVRKEGSAREQRVADDPKARDQLREKCSGRNC